MPSIAELPDSPTGVSTIVGMSLGLGFLIVLSWDEAPARESSEPFDSFAWDPSVVGRLEFCVAFLEVVASGFLGAASGGSISSKDGIFKSHDCVARLRDTLEEAELGASDRQAVVESSPTLWIAIISICGTRCRASVASG